MTPWSGIFSVIYSGFSACFLGSHFQNKTRQDKNACKFSLAGSLPKKKKKRFPSHLHISILLLSPSTSTCCHFFPIVIVFSSQHTCKLYLNNNINYSDKISILIAILCSHCFSELLKDTLSMFHHHLLEEMLCVYYLC